MRSLWHILVRLAYPILKTYWFIVRPRTRGVKCLLLHDNEILLVRHSYGSPNWTVPGGGIKSGESKRDAIVREVAEEVGLTITEPSFCGSVFHILEYKRDTIFVFTATVSDPAFEIDGTEIQTAAWYPLDALPTDTASLLPEFLRVAGCRGRVENNE